MEVRELDHRLIEGEQIEVTLWQQNETLLDAHALTTATAFGSLVLPCVVDQDASDHLCRNGKEVGAILPVYAVLLDQTDVGLVDERRSLECVIGAFTHKVRFGQCPKLIVHEGHETADGRVAAATHLLEDSSYINVLRITHAFTNNERTKFLLLSPLTIVAFLIGRNKAISPESRVID